MAQDILETAGRQAGEVISSPALRGLRRISMGTIQHPGQRPRRYLAGGMKLTSEQRADAERYLAVLQADVEAAKLPQANKARLAILARMLMAYPGSTGTADTARARAEVYLSVVDDLPPAAVEMAIRRWNRGEGDGNHDFAPSPARLRSMACDQVQPHLEAIQHLQDLLQAVPLDLAIDSRPVQAPVRTTQTRDYSIPAPRLKTMSEVAGR